MDKELIDGYLIPPSFITAVSNTKQSQQLNLGTTQ
jgi:hypothetical protein